MDDQENKDLFDLGSEQVDDDFDPFASDDEQETDITNDESNASEQKTQTVPSTTNKAKAETSAKQSEEKGSKAEQNLSEKLPVFEYAGATENIDDVSKTFEELRIEKSSDFPELEDGKRVSWTVEYGKVIKTVSDAKGTSIGKIKTDIETSKEFTEGLKKAKDKNPICKVKPRVIAQSKGNAAAYKGVFTNLSDAETSGKVISILPAKDGNVYEIRNTEMGKFITSVSGCEMLSDIRAGFIPALPRIPAELMMKIISLFRYYARNGIDKEVLVNVYWDKENKKFVLDVPQQMVAKASINSQFNEDYADNRYIHYMDIHSHNSMRAFFSDVDDADEKATRLYTVIGELHKYFPDIKTRISNGGKFFEIEPSKVFDYIGQRFPEAWKGNIHFNSCYANKNINLHSLYEDNKTFSNKNGVDAA